MVFKLNKNLFKVGGGYVGVGEKMDLDQTVQAISGVLTYNLRGYCYKGFKILFATSHLNLFDKGIPLLTVTDDTEAEVLFQNTFGPKLEKAGHTDDQILHCMVGFIEGYAQARKKYGFSEEELGRAIDLAQVANTASFDNIDFPYNEKSILKLLSLPKNILELELESEGDNLVIEDGSVIIENIKYN